MSDLHLRGDRDTGDGREVAGASTSKAPQERVKDEEVTLSGRRRALLARDRLKYRLGYDDSLDAVADEFEDAGLDATVHAEQGYEFGDMTIGSRARDRTTV